MMVSRATSNAVPTARRLPAGHRAASFSISYRFDHADDVLSWATRKQQTLQKRGWERA